MGYLLAFCTNNSNLIPENFLEVGEYVENKNQKLGEVAD